MCASLQPFRIHQSDPYSSLNVYLRKYKQARNRQRASKPITSLLAATLPCELDTYQRKEQLLSTPTSRHSLTLSDASRPSDDLNITDQEAPREIDVLSVLDRSDSRGEEQQFSPIDQYVIRHHSSASLENTSDVEQEQAEIDLRVDYSYTSFESYESAQKEPQQKVGADFECEMEEEIFNFSEEEESETMKSEEVEEEIAEEFNDSREEEDVAEVV